MYHVSAQGVDERMINVHYYHKSVSGKRHLVSAKYKSNKAK